MHGPFSFQVHHVDAGSAARRATFRTPHGPVEMPAFMPVGTQASVKGIEVMQLRRTGTQMILGNTYHLVLRPGEDVIHQLGGLHPFMGWNGPILTDSGGFQLFSLARMTEVTDQGATFRSHIDGRLLHLSPERVIQIQEALGSDVAMVLDHVVGLPNSPDQIRDATERTVRWAARSKAAARLSDQALFGIVQGGLDEDLRLWCTEKLTAIGFDGYAIGGLSVGEGTRDMYRIVRATAPALPADRPRYLMGIGRPEDLLEAIRCGIDLFDCVMPTRNGRNASAFTDRGVLKLRNLRYQRDPTPVEPGCPCPACRRSRAYIRHLFIAGEMLGPVLLSIHNLTYYQRLMAQARRAIEENRFEQFRQSKREGWGLDEGSSGEKA